MKKVRLGIIGIGTVFQKKHLPALGCLKNKFDVTGVYTSDRKKFVSIKDTYKNAVLCSKLPDLLQKDDVDAVVACVPLPKHYEIIKSVLKYKKNVIVEKPLVHTLSAANNVKALVQKNKANVMVCENFRYLSSVEKLKDVLAKKQLGDVKLVKICALTDLSKNKAYYQSKWRKTPRSYPGILWEGGIHFVSVLNYLFGSIHWGERKFSSVNPDLAKFDTVTAQAKVGKAVDVSMVISYSIDDYQDCFLKVYGTKGKAECGMSYLSVESNAKKKRYEYKFEEYEKIYKEFYDLITVNKSPRYAFSHAYDDLTQLDSFFNSKHR